MNKCEKLWMRFCITLEVFLLTRRDAKPGIVAVPRLPPNQTNSIMLILFHFPSLLGYWWSDSYRKRSAQIYNPQEVTY